MAKLHFHYSVMNAGKTTQLLQVRHNYIENGGLVLLFTSALDDRAGVGRVSSRIGLSAEAVPLRKSDDLRAIVSEIHRKTPVTVVLIDEVQFLTPEHIWQAAHLVDEFNVPVMTYGLKNNVFGELFSPAICTLLALAEDIKEIKQLCHCGRKATMILRYDPDGKAVKTGEVIEIGGESRYISVCRPHWVEGDIGASRRAALTCAAA
ncbi:thymidine kinase [Microvirga flavescens]|uniref:thymidine kinase n=1 Tax=Microvirga flavescens TaxID=2249811 RepID=UPI000DD5D2BB|nr:thymidine kinase [Microvirga flavescens]